MAEDNRVNEALRSLLSEAARALEPFAEFAVKDRPVGDRHHTRDCVPLNLWFNGKPGTRPTMGDCREAAAVLAKIDRHTPAPPS